MHILACRYGRDMNMNLEECNLRRYLFDIISFLTDSSSSGINEIQTNLFLPAKRVRPVTNACQSFGQKG